MGDQISWFVELAVMHLINQIQSFLDE